MRRKAAWMPQRVTSSPLQCSITLYRCQRRRWKHGICGQTQCGGLSWKMSWLNFTSCQWWRRVKETGISDGMQKADHIIFRFNKLRFNSKHCIVVYGWNTMLGMIVAVLQSMDEGKCDEKWVFLLSTTKNWTERYRFHSQTIHLHTILPQCNEAL